MTISFKRENMTEEAAKTSNNRKSSKWMIPGAVKLRIIMGPISGALLFLLILIIFFLNID